VFVVVVEKLNREGGRIGVNNFRGEALSCGGFEQHGPEDRVIPGKLLGKNVNGDHSIFADIYKSTGDACRWRQSVSV
jgi:hypothetical protein